MTETLSKFAWIALTAFLVITLVLGTGANSAKTKMEAQQTGVNAEIDKITYDLSGE